MFGHEEEELEASIPDPVLAHLADIKRPVGPSESCRVADIFAGYPTHKLMRL